MNMIVCFNLVDRILALWYLDSYKRQANITEFDHIIITPVLQNFQW